MLADMPLKGFLLTVGERRPFPVEDVAFHLTRFWIELEEWPEASTVDTEGKVDFRLRMGGEVIE